MLLMGLLTALSLYVAQRDTAKSFAENFQREFQSAVAGRQALAEARRAMLAEHCRTLVRKPRIHAALEDNALDLLYPSARDELRDLMARDAEGPPHGLPAEFYRFLDAGGAVIPAGNAEYAGKLTEQEETQLALPRAPEGEQIGYLERSAGASATIDETIAMPIVSSESGETIAALIVGFQAPAFGSPSKAGIKSGVWLNGRMHLREVSVEGQTALGKEVAHFLRNDVAQKSFPVVVDGAPQLLFCKLLNPGSLFPPGYEVCLYPLTESRARQRQLQWQILGAGALLMLVGLVTSQAIAAQFSAPVERLAVDSEANRALRVKAEAELEATSLELERAERFSSDASHQLKTPVAVLRAGLEELLVREDLPEPARQEVEALIGQTSRLTHIVEDLLLLSRMDAGRLQLDFSPVNISQLIDAWLDDLSALPDDLNLTAQTDVPPNLCIAGEKRYTTLILQNLLVNATKYNRPGGWIRVSAEVKDGWVLLNICNSGAPIPLAAQEHIFERFHRGGAAENVPGHGLGLNLARELARIHGGDLCLVRSDSSGTEFQARFRLAEAARPAYVGA